LLAAHYKEVIKLIGEDEMREGLLDTPMRVAKSIQFLTHGYNLIPEDIIKSAMFKEEYQQTNFVGIYGFKFFFGSTNCIINN